MRLDERGKQCPLPVIEAKKALEQAEPGSVVEVVVDNEIAVQNLKKLADHKGLASASEKVSDREFLVKITAAKKAESDEAAEAAAAKETAGDVAAADELRNAAAEEISCQADSREKGMVVVLASDQMGQGDEVLGKLLMKGFVYALTQQDKLPETVLLFNGGARLSCKDSDSLHDLKELEAQGTEILTCGTCLNHYGLSEQLAVGSVTNMYEIVERMTQARKLVRP
ncbi:MAG: sulfurtransferase-like selenium metabolism protein YedF [Lachnospiraceae bacterium]|nr:sulfurtransferase-like selenium metabolism protein YedF [Lachnospiraceae bacterium]MDO5550207.1 sulfurtransferase-like selenium metabolism protein YedF [Lachnospiraceae bacterium]